MENQREQVIRWAMEHFGVEPEYPWPDSPEAFVLRHPNSGKWFGVVMAVSRARLGLPEGGHPQCEGGPPPSGLFAGDSGLSPGVSYEQAPLGLPAAGRPFGGGGHPPSAGYEL